MIIVVICLVCIFRSRSSGIILIYHDARCRCACCAHLRYHNRLIACCFSTINVVIHSEKNSVYGSIIIIQSYCHRITSTRCLAQCYTHCHGPGRLTFLNYGRRDRSNLNCLRKTVWRSKAHHEQKSRQKANCFVKIHPIDLLKNVRIE